MSRYTIPTWFVPRDYQIPVWEAMVVKGMKRAILVWPRRAGKDVTTLNIIAYHALLLRTGNYYYFFPTYAQGKKAVWDGKDNSGRAFMSVFPGWPKTIQEDPDSQIVSINAQEMKVTLKNGSMFQIIGASDKDSVMGTNPIGCAFSEYSLRTFDPACYDFVRPILLQNDGFAIFPYTMRGLTHGWRLYDKNKNNPAWHVEFHTCETLKHDNRRVVTDSMIEEERASGMPEETIQQEFYNDPYASNSGAYYSQQMRDIKNTGRVGDVPWRPEMPVHTAWDLGKNDATAIWFFQVDASGNVNIIDTYTNTGESIGHYCKILHTKPYVYGDHYGPWDLTMANFSTDRTTLEVAQSLGIVFTVVPRIAVQDGIDAARMLLPRCRFDAKNCYAGLEALRQYCKEESGLMDMDGRPIFRDKPIHDWTSHFADAFRYLAVAMGKFVCNNNNITSDTSNEEYDVLGY
jgi:phage terminase large subunit